MKFKIGDKVRVTCVDNEQNLFKTKFIGRVFTIKKLDPNGRGVYRYPHYAVEEDDCIFVWLENELEKVEEKKVFTKSDLKNGDILKKRNGDIEVVIVDSGLRIILESRGYQGYNYLSDLNEDLTHRKLGDAHDVVAVRRPKQGVNCNYSLFSGAMGDLVYDRERDTIRELTIDEIEKEFGIKVKFERV